MLVLKLLTHISKGHFNLSNAEFSRSLLQLQVTTRLILVKQYVVCQCVVVILCSKECCISTRRVIDAACICRGNVNNMVWFLPLDCIHVKMLIHSCSWINVWCICVPIPCQVFVINEFSFELPVVNFYRSAKQTSYWWWKSLTCYSTYLKSLSSFVSTINLWKRNIREWRTF